MTSPVTWRDATKADRGQLQLFVCTETVRRRQPFKGQRVGATFEHEWEVEAQSYIRGMKPPAPPLQMMLIGEDETGLAAVAWTQQVDGPHDVFVKVAGVALRLRAVGGSSVGSQMMNEIVQRHMSILEASSSDEEELIISGNVDRRNTASQSFCRRNDAERFDHDPQYDQWVIRVPRPMF